jgi:transposase
MRVVNIKSAEQLAWQALHRMRARLIHDRTATANQMRSVLSEEGFVFPQGLAGFRTRLIALLDTPECVTPMLRELARRFLEQINTLDEWIDGINAQLRHAFRADTTCQQLTGVPGIGPVIATAVVGTVGNARAFKNGRQFAAWMGLTPRQHSSGERTRLLGITKRGDAYLRTLLVQGARAVLRTVARRRDRLGQWLQQLLIRRHKHVVAIVLANKDGPCDLGRTRERHRLPSRPDGDAGVTNTGPLCRLRRDVTMAPRSDRHLQILLYPPAAGKPSGR